MKRILILVVAILALNSCTKKDDVVVPDYKCYTCKKVYHSTYNNYTSTTEEQFCGSYQEMLDFAKKNTFTISSPGNTQDNNCYCN